MGHMMWVEEEESEGGCSGEEIVVESVCLARSCLAQCYVALSETWSHLPPTHAPRRERLTWRRLRMKERGKLQSRGTKQIPAEHTER